MAQKQVKISQCIVGDIIVKDITNENGVTLISKGTVINSFIKARLSQVHRGKVWIYDSAYKHVISNIDCSFLHVEKDYKRITLKVKRLFEELILGSKTSIQLLNSICLDIKKSIENKDDIFKQMQLVKDYDMCTYTHSFNVAFYAMMIGRWMNFKEEQMVELIKAGLLHDIGKINIPLDIINKNGKLTSKEYEIMKWHTTFGYDILDEINGISEQVKIAVFGHHERMDGSGYPKGLSGDSIDLYSKIIAIADVYDVITSDRAYKKKATPFEAFRIFLSEGKRLFDIPITKLFLQNLSCNLIGMRVCLSNGEIGEVVFIPPQDIQNPIISVGSTIIDLSKATNVKILSMEIT